MIRPLRKVHRWTFVGLGLGLPVLFLFAMRGATAGVIAAKGDPMPYVGEEGLEEPQVILEGGRWSVELPLDWNEPDVLVYAASREAGDELPPDARLIGPLIPGRKAPLPQAVGDPEYVVLYSLPRQEVLLSQRVGGKS